MKLCMESGRLRFTAESFVGLHRYALVMQARLGKGQIIQGRQEHVSSLSLAKQRQPDANRRLRRHNLFDLSSMSLHEIWQAAASSPFEPSVGKDNQLYVGFILLFIGNILYVQTYLKDCTNAV